MTVSENLRDVAEKIVVSLPPQFVALLCINLVFVMGMLWFMHDLSLARIEAVKEIFTQCTTLLGQQHIHN